MSCPNCCAGITAMPKSIRKFVDWDYICNSAKYFQGLEINITGGEPSIHPEFENWTPKLKELFNSPKLSVWTNATMFKKKPEAFRPFDIIHITNYKRAYKGSPDNTEDIAFIKNYLPKHKINVVHAEHLEPNNKTGMCFRATVNSSAVEFVDGFVYPCSSSSGLKTKIRLPLNEDWKNIIKIKPPCNECIFAE